MYSGPLRGFDWYLLKIRMDVWSALQPTILPSDKVENKLKQLAIYDDSSCSDESEVDLPSDVSTFASNEATEVPQPNPLAQYMPRISVPLQRFMNHKFLESSSRVQRGNSKEDLTSSKSLHRSRAAYGHADRAVDQRSTGTDAQYIRLPGNYTATIHIDLTAKSSPTNPATRSRHRQNYGFEKQDIVECNFESTFIDDSDWIKQRHTVKTALVQNQTTAKSASDRIIHIPRTQLMQLSCQHLFLVDMQDLLRYLECDETTSFRVYSVLPLSQLDCELLANAEVGSREFFEKLAVLTEIDQPVIVLLWGKLLKKTAFINTPVTVRYLRHRLLEMET